VTTTIPEELQIDPGAACQEIKTLIKNTLDTLYRDGAVVALSGGLDSAVAASLTVNALGRDRVHLLNMTERDSKPIHRKHAKQFAEFAGVRLSKRRISPILKAAGSYKLLPLRFAPSRKLRSKIIDFSKSKIISDYRDNSLLSRRLQTKPHSWLARANAYAIAKHRIRLAVIYQFAEVRNLMVVGAANRTEWMTGTFSKWGVDHCADIMPIIHIYRSQLEQLAKYLQIPNYIRYKDADPDVIPGVNDKGALLGTFPVVDQILYCIENHADLEEMHRIHGEERVDRLLQLVDLSRHMRESPYRFPIHQ